MPLLNNASYETKLRGVLLLAPETTSTMDSGDRALWMNVSSALSSSSRGTLPKPRSARLVWLECSHRNCVTSCFDQPWLDDSQRQMPKTRNPVDTQEITCHVTSSGRLPIIPAATIQLRNS